MKSSVEPDESEGEEAPVDRAKAESIKNQIIQAAGSWGFSYETEKSVNQGTGRVDIVLSLGDLVIACEISATTRAQHEYEHSIRKCLQAGFERIFLVCNAARRRIKIQELVEIGCIPAEQKRVSCLTVHEFLEKLTGLAATVRADQAPTAKTGEQTSSPNVSAKEKEDILKRIWEDIERKKKKDRGQ